MLISCVFNIQFNIIRAGTLTSPKWAPPLCYLDLTAYTSHLPMRTTYNPVSQPPLHGRLTRDEAGCLQLIKFLIFQHSESP